MRVSPPYPPDPLLPKSTYSFFKYANLLDSLDGKFEAAKSENRHVSILGINLVLTAFYLYFTFII